MFLCLKFIFLFYLNVYYVTLVDKIANSDIDHWMTLVHYVYWKLYNIYFYKSLVGDRLNPRIV